MAGEPTIRFGSKGPFVADAQQKLLVKGFDPGPVDGDFGSRTRQAVIAFQSANALLADGIVGNQTWAALNDETPAPPGVRTGAGTGTSTRPKVVFVGDPVFDGTLLTYTAQNVSGVVIAQESMVDVADVAFAGTTESSRVEFATPPGGPIETSETYAMDLSLEQFTPGSVVVVRIELDSRNVPDGPELEVMVTVGVPGVVVLRPGQQPRPQRPPVGGGGVGGGITARVVVDGDPTVDAGVITWRGRNVSGQTIDAMTLVDLLVVNHEIEPASAENVVNQGFTVPPSPVEPDGTYEFSVDLTNLDPGEYSGVVQVDAQGPSVASPESAGVFRFTIAGSPGGGPGGGGFPSVAIASGPAVGDGAVFYEAANVGDGVLPAFGHIDQIQVFDGATSDLVFTAGRGAPPDDVGPNGTYTSSIVLDDLPPGTFSVVLTVDADAVTGASAVAVSTFTVPGGGEKGQGAGEEFSGVASDLFDDL